jgi:hypothetical protein
VVLEGFAARGWRLEKSNVAGERRRASRSQRIVHAISSPGQVAQNAAA